MIAFVLALMIGFQAISNNGLLFAYAQDDIIATYNIGVDGENVKATLRTSGVLSLTGTGETKDYTPETMPFSDNIDKITTLEIEDGITSLGDYLFFGCKNLNDKLELPATITSIGNYAFSGYSKENAPTFTYIDNKFTSANISVPVTTTEPKQDTTDTPAQSEEQKVEDTVSPTESPAKEDTANTAELPKEDTQPQTKEVTTMEIKTITEQEMGTDIFFEGQTGGYKANETNKSFRAAAEKAGYIEADRFITVSLDGVITQTLPVKDGKMTVPNLPNFGIVSPESDDAYTTHTFSSWSYENATYQPADQMEVSENADKVTLTSNWNTEWKINPQVKTEAKEEISVYSVIDANTGKALKKADGYALTVQWQINKGDEKNEKEWKDIEDATELAYERKVESGDTSSHFRAKVSILRQAKTRSINEPKTMMTDAVTGIANQKINSGQIKVIYHYNDSSTAEIKDGQSGTWNPGDKTYTLSTNVNLITSSDKLYGEIYDSSTMYQYHIDLINNPFKTTPTSANGVNDVNDIANWVLGNKTGAYTNWNYPDGSIGYSGGLTNPYTDLTNPDYYSTDSTYILSKQEMQQYENGGNLELHFYAYWGKIVYVSDTDKGKADGSTINDTINVNKTKFDNALNKLSGGDMFSNVMMLTSDITLLSPIYEDYNFKSMVNIPVTFQSLKNGDRRYQLIIPNRGPQFFSDVRFTNISITTVTSRYPAILNENAYLFMDDNVISYLNYRNTIYDLNNMTSSIGGTDYRLGLFGGTKGMRVESGIYRRITGSMNVIETSNVMVVGSDITNPPNFNDELVGARVDTTNTNIIVGGYLTGVGVVSGASDGNIKGDSKLTVLEDSVLSWGVYENGKFISKTSMFGGGRKGSLNNSTTIINQNTIINGNVYGSGDSSTTNGISSLTINKARIYGDIYAGGNKGTSNSTSLIISNSSIYGNIFGGGNVSNTNSSQIEFVGNCSLTGNIYGGSNASGTTTTSNVNIKGTVTNNVYAGGKGVDTAVTNTNLNVETGADIKGNAFGGSEEGTVTNSTVNLNGGKANNVFGGSDKASITGSVEINSLAGSNATNIYAGCNASGSVKNPILNLAGKSTNVFGGGNATPNDTEDVEGTSTINVTTNEANTITNVYGGSNSTGKVTSPQVNISGYVENAYGGGLGKDTITNTPLVNVKTGGNVTGSVFGGGEEGAVAGTTVTLENGSTVKNAYAGGNKAGVTGTVKLITLAGSTATSIYGGSNSSGTVTKPILEIAGDAKNVFGGGFEGGTNSGNNGTIVDTPSITVTGGTITNVYGGGEKGPSVNTNTITIKGGTITDVFGGGKSASSDNTSIKLENNSNAISSSVTNIYGGSESSGLTKKSNIEVNGNVTNVFGGGKGQNTKVTETYIKTLKNSQAEYVYGGSEQGTVGKATAIVMGPVEKSIYGGGLGATSTVTGDTWVFVSNDVKDSVYGGGNEGGVEGNTHVDIAKGTIGTSGNDKTGNVYGGSNQAKVKGNTLVHIGSYVVNTPDGAVLPTGTEKNIDIKGTVFGGGNTTSTGKDFDASDPYVLGNATVEIGGTDYQSLKIDGSIFGDGNKCVTKGDKKINIIDYTATGTNANQSIQRASTLTIEHSTIEILGEVDSANLVTTIPYSLNRIDDLVLKNGSTLKLRNGVNLLMGFGSQNADGSLQTAAEANNDTSGNKIYLKQGEHLELRVNEDVSRPGYGDVKGFAQLGRYDIDATGAETPITENAQGVYIMGGLYPTPADNNASGFIVANSENFSGQEPVTKGDKITPTTNNSSWRNWNLGSQTKTIKEKLIISDDPGNAKTAQIDTKWDADGSIYRVNADSLKISNGSPYTIVDPDTITKNGNENTIGISIETGQTGWLEQSKAGYIDSTGKIIPYKETTSFSKTNSLDMRSLTVTGQSPIINVKLYNSDNITSNSTGDVTVTFSIDKIAEQPDGSEIKTGTIIVELTITKETTSSYTHALIGQGKIYDRAIQEYNFNTATEVGTTVSQNSSITTQFVEKTQTAKSISGYSIGFTSAKTNNVVNLPAGTKILMVDRSGNQPVYYHYDVAAATNSISLTDFTKNGSGDKYTLPTSTITRNNFIFVVDFAGAGSFDNSDICMAFNTATGGTTTSKKVRFGITGSPRKYKMILNEENGSATSVPSYRMNGTFGLTVNSTVTSGSTTTDTTGSDKQMAARVQLKLTNTTTGAIIPIPAGWQIQSNGTRYSTSGDSATVILANSLTAATSDIYVIMSNMGDNLAGAGNYKLEISLVGGPMANYPTDTLSTDYGQYRFKLIDDRYSIQSAIGEEHKQIIAKDATDKTQTYSLIRTSNGSSDTSSIKTELTLWKKNASNTYERVVIGTYLKSIKGASMGTMKPLTIDNTNNCVVIPWYIMYNLETELQKEIASGTYQWRYTIRQTTGEGSAAVTTDLVTEKNTFIITDD